MCGIFGFISTEGRGPDIDRLRRIALVTQTRGMHAFGLAWLDENGTIQTFKRPGAAQRHLKELERCRRAIVMVGHCRYATHGSPADNRNNHPHAAGAGWLVHNGVVHNHEAIVEHYQLRQHGECDSEALGLLMARCPGTINQRAAWTANVAEGDLAMLGIWAKPARLLVCRRGRPLHFSPGRGGYYFASLAEGLPGKAKMIADRRTRVLVYRDGQLDLDGKGIELNRGGTSINHLNPFNINELSEKRP
jgi:glucosamine 6-phosphate synthetase-like amidotransferase/phosphosugar isomerase protein